MTHPHYQNLLSLFSLRLKSLDSAEIACLTFLSCAMNTYVHIPAEMLECTCTHTQMEIWNTDFITQLMTALCIKHLKTHKIINTNV